MTIINRFTSLRVSEPSLLDHAISLLVKILLSYRPDLKLVNNVTHIHLAI